MTEAEAVKLVCTIGLPTRVTRGEPVVLTFQIDNVGTTTVAVLTWATPLEGLLSRMFRVTHDGAELAYAGPLVKRGAPTADDYVTLLPGAGASETVDLRAAYALDAPGDYEVTYTAQLLDVVVAGEPAPRPDQSQRPFPLTCPAAHTRIVEPHP